MSVKINCNSCGKEITISEARYEEYQGEIVRCPYCKDKTVVSKSSTESKTEDKSNIPANAVNNDFKKEIQPNVNVYSEIKTNQEPTKKCPMCGEQILAIAKKCKHCGEYLDVSLVNIEKEVDKNPGIAAVLSVVLPGAGHMYIGRVKEGIFRLIAQLILAIATVMSLLAGNEKAQAWGLILMVVSVFLYLSSIIGSAIACKKNQKNRVISIILFLGFLLALALTLGVIWRLNH